MIFSRTTVQYQETFFFHLRRTARKTTKRKWNYYVQLIDKQAAGIEGLQPVLLGRKIEKILENWKKNGIYLSWWMRKGRGQTS
jgi:hypothetical protein